MGGGGPGWGGSQQPCQPAASPQPARSQLAASSDEQQAGTFSGHAPSVYSRESEPVPGYHMIGSLELDLTFEGPVPRATGLNQLEGEPPNLSPSSGVRARLTRGTDHRRLALFTCSGTFQFGLQKLRVAVLMSIVPLGAGRNRVWGADRKKNLPEPWNSCPESLPPALRHSACRQAHAGSTTPAQRLMAVSG